jgi:hypothetical protein
MNQEPKYFHEFFDIEGKPTHRELIVNRLKQILNRREYTVINKPMSSYDTSVAVANIDGNLWKFEFSEDSWSWYEDNLGDHFSFDKVAMVQEAQKTITVYEPVERPTQAKVLKKIRDFGGTGGSEEYKSLEQELDNTYFKVGDTKNIGPFSVTLLKSQIVDAEFDPGSITVKQIYNIDGFPFIMYTTDNSWEHVFNLEFSRLQPARKVMVEDYEEVK